MLVGVVGSMGVRGGAVVVEAREGEGERLGRERGLGWPRGSPRGGSARGRNEEEEEEAWGGRGKKGQGGRWRPRAPSPAPAPGLAIGAGRGKYG